MKIISKNPCNSRCVNTLHHCVLYTTLDAKFVLFPVVYKRRTAKEPATRRIDLVLCKVVSTVYVRGLHMGRWHD